jgi:hypothetical protein
VHSFLIGVLTVLFYVVCVRFSARGVQKHDKNISKKPTSKTFYKKLKKKKTFAAVSCHLALRFILIAVSVVSLHDELKNTTQDLQK